DLRADTDPVLTEVHTVDLVSEIRLPDMGAAVAYALDFSKILAGRGRDPSLRGHRRAGLGQPVHQEVALLEIRQQLAAQGRYRQYSTDEQRQGHCDGRERLADQWCEKRGIR